MIYDITPQKRQEEQLREAEERYRAIVEHVPVGRSTWTRSGPRWRSLYVSPVIEQMMGVTSEEWMADAELWLELMHPDDREAMAGRLLRRRPEPGAVECEYRILTRDGRTIWVHDETTFLHDEARHAEVHPGRDQRHHRSQARRARAA